MSELNRVRRVVVHLAGGHRIGLRFTVTPEGCTLEWQWPDVNLGWKTFWTTTSTRFYKDRHEPILAEKYTLLKFFRLFRESPESILEFYKSIPYEVFPPDEAPPPEEELQEMARNFQEKVCRGFFGPKVRRILASVGMRRK